MKLNRFPTITILMVVLVICAGVLLSSCASLGKKKGAGPDTEASQGLDSQSTAVAESSGGTPEARNVPVAYKGGSGEKARARDAGISTGGDRIEHFATSVREALDRVFPASLPELNWDRITTVLGGIVALSLIYGLAFGLARLPLRSRGTGRPSRSRPADLRAGQKIGPAVNVST